MAGVAAGATPKPRDPKRYVKLNVGGQLFCTTRDTLSKQGQHMLSAMFSGRMEVSEDEDGYVHIDRDGRYFGLVLNFLRDGHVALPDGCEAKEALLAEARFYTLQPLVVQVETALAETFQPSCQVVIITSPKEEARVVASSKAGPPLIKFVYSRSNNKFSYTPPSDDALLKNIELFDKVSRKFSRRVTFAKDTSGRNGHICTWFFYGKGRLISEVCCTSMVYAAEKKHTKIEFPEARLYEECLNVLLFEKSDAAGGTDDELEPAETGDYLARHASSRASGVSLF